MLGPPIGSFIYGLLGFSWTFWVFSVLILANLLMLVVFLPDQLNHDEHALVEFPSTLDDDLGQFGGTVIEMISTQSDDTNASEIRRLTEGYNLLNSETLSLFKILRVKGMLFSALAQGLAHYNLGFFSSFISVYVVSHYGILEEQMGYVFICLSLPYFLSCAFLPRLLQKVPARLQFVAGITISSVSLALMGPSTIFGFSDKNLWIILIGLFLMGISQSLAFVPGIPEGIESV